jgi:ribose/xylose/arabinose/galactoside ABC-type transport system permease subunit
VILGLCCVWWVVRRTSFATNIYAVGGDRKAARASGIHDGPVTIAVYAASGTLAAIAGLILAATTTGGDPHNGDIFTLTSVAAVVVGGVSLAGGRGSAIGAVIGAAILTLLTSLLVVLELNPLYVSLWQGAFLLAAAVLAVVLQGFHKRLLAGRTEPRRHDAVE